MGDDVGHVLRGEPELFGAQHERATERGAAADFAGGHHLREAAGGLDDQGIAGAQHDAVNLAAVVTTATGEQRRVEIGNATANIDASKVLQAAPVSATLSFQVDSSVCATHNAPTSGGGKS